MDGDKKRPSRLGDLTERDHQPQNHPAASTPRPIQAAISEHLTQGQDQLDATSSSGINDVI